jgi:hypothetical protein
MDLGSTCASFSRSECRKDLAENASLLIELIQKGVNEPIHMSVINADLIRASVQARCVAVENGVRDARRWSSCDTLSLVETGPWDSLHLILFLVECHLKIIIAKLYGDKKGWHFESGAFEGGGFETDLLLAMQEEEIRKGKHDLELGIEPRTVSALLAESDMSRITASIVVCFEGIVEENLKKNDAFFSGNRPSRRAVRMLERRFLIDDTKFFLDYQLNKHLLNEEVTDIFSHTEYVTSWMKKTVEVDANNTLLLRLDEWGVACLITPLQVAHATGERGIVPQEHRNTPAAWVAQASLPDDEYRVLMVSAKKNAAHPENVYVCFSAMLEQHFGFEWMTRCLVSRLDPFMALRKVREYLAAVNERTPPLVIQRENSRATILFRANDGSIKRAECSSPEEAVSAWMQIVLECTRGGAYTRKANIKDVIERIRRPPQIQKESLPDEIGGEIIKVH